MHLTLYLLVLHFNKATYWAGKKRGGVPTVAQWLRNLTRNDEVVGSIPGLDHWVKDPVLP